MYRNGRYPDDLYSDAWNAQPYNAEIPSEPRRERRFRGQRRAYRRGESRRREDPYGDYVYDGPSSSQSAYHDTSSQPYYDAPSRHYRGDARDGYHSGYRDGIGSSSSREHSRSGVYQHPNYDRRRSPPVHRDYEQDYNYKNDNHAAEDSSSNHYRRKMSSKYKYKSNSKSPSSPPPPIPTSPSPSYLALSLIPSSHCSPPTFQSTSPLPSSSPITSTASRKLLILDLNGTLLVRLRPSGPPHPRPYMPSFRDYLFASRTRAWLDVMVWSSAQPHNVERMVRRCFFDGRLGPPLPASVDEGNEEPVDASEKEWEGKLVAVWARNTLGLSKSDYTKKSKTTKDLSKPWSSLSSSGNTHSALTTFLLDDSPAKVRLQPYNHVCVSEYGKEGLAQDIEVKRRREGEGLTLTPASSMDGKVERDGKEGKKVHKKDKKKKKKLQDRIDAGLQQDSTRQEGDRDRAHAHHAHSNSDAAVLESSTQGENNDSSQCHYHDGQQDTQLQKRASISPIPTNSSPNLPIPTPNVLEPEQDSDLDRGDQGEYEPTLLAVIGILEALKWESNVAGWIRAGGLWGPAGRKPQTVLTAAAGGAGMIIDGERAASPTDLELEVAEEEAPAPPSSSPTSSQVKRQRSGASEGDWHGHDVKRTRFGWAAEAEAEEAPRSGNDAQTHVDDLLANEETGTGANKETGAEETKMWFEDEETVRYWVGRGRAALSELGIEERDGVCLE